ncbi:hypothetical protein GEV33_012874 [Tenebrio molitor]|uniref:Uncharacterized protein n=1 Tax=Tenebrio molitor TaxID=7067 RepID=A0A8J6LEI3_TENMO|nr:hypothetical protein GEV33_012874 [Tenebrio molitor]
MPILVAGSSFTIPYMVVRQETSLSGHVDSNIEHASRIYFGSRRHIKTARKTHPELVISPERAPRLSDRVGGAYPADAKCMQLLLRDAGRAISTGRANLYARASLLARIITAEDGRRPASCFASQECNHGRLVTGTAEVPESAGRRRSPLAGVVDRGRSRYVKSPQVPCSTPESTTPQTVRNAQHKSTQSMI